MHSSSVPQEGLGNENGKRSLSDKQLDVTDSPYLPRETLVRRCVARFKIPEPNQERVEGDDFVDQAEQMLTGDALLQDLRDETGDQNTSRIYFVNIAPHEYRLHDSALSQDSLRHLIQHYAIPSTFLETLSPEAIPPARGCWPDDRQEHDVYHEWTSVPTPISFEFLREQHRQSSLDDDAIAHSTLPMSLYIRRDVKRQAYTVIVINFLGEDLAAYRKTIEEYLASEARGMAIGRDNFGFNAYILVHLKSLMPRWEEALKNIDGSLSFDESRLQTRPGDRFAPLSNRHSHADEVREHLYVTAAHLRRYRSSMKPLIERAYFFNYMEIRANQLEKLRDEMEAKAADIIELATKRIQILNDQQMVANGVAMQKALEAMQQEAETTRLIAEQSSLLAEEMRRDSAAMRTIAVMTLFFLPGTAFAALFSMPFFEADDWFHDINKIWLWFVLTLPSMVLAFIFYHYMQPRGLQSRRRFDLESNSHQDPQSSMQLLEPEKET